MDIRPIRTEADYDWALAEVEQYFVHEPEPGTEEADRFDVLSSLIEAYEAKAWPIEAPDAVDAVKTIMADRHISREKLVPVFGSKSRLSEFLNRKRGLTMAVANRLHVELQIPASVLIRPYAMLPRSATEKKRRAGVGRSRA
ncbi:XRE family transcriptional regulator [Aureimonas endophytica]|uniref:XRE family transcriptional regulator n=1 Tax=Aureimonas endophytica TaxID=2027858 RepID=A0A916ZKU0_9HYPH|nr:XRE family transcriptional regulator [Aureimonas endophytica]GGE02628.1 XRE family transcriptional regulator [Aureimonas endophytica]